VAGWLDLPWLELSKSTTLFAVVYDITGAVFHMHDRDAVERLDFGWARFGDILLMVARRIIDKMHRISDLVRLISRMNMQ
jgi:hypothetical protein